MPLVKGTNSNRAYEGRVYRKPVGDQRRPHGQIRVGRWQQADDGVGDRCRHGHPDLTVACFQERAERDGVRRHPDRQQRPQDIGSLPSPDHESSDPERHRDETEPMHFLHPECVLRGEPLCDGIPPPGVDQVRQEHVVDIQRPESQVDDGTAHALVSGELQHLVEEREHDDERHRGARGNAPPPRGVSPDVAPACANQRIDREDQRQRIAVLPATQRDEGDAQPQPDRPARGFDGRENARTQTA